MNSYNIKSIFLVYILGISLVSCKDGSSGGHRSAEALVVPTVIQKIEAINSYTPEHVANLTRLAIAIERFKQDHHRYPLASMSRRDWDTLFTENGELNSAWLSELTPIYIETIPLALNQDKRNEYVYKSDGANYKLLVVNAGDCEYVKSKTPDLIDPLRDCRAYGFWTRKAVKW